MVLKAIKEFFMENNEDTGDEIQSFNIWHTQIYMDLQISLI
jgi:hypothetical protein